MNGHPHIIATGSPSPGGKCGWRRHAFGVDLRCDENAIPGGALCADHLIEEASEKK